MGGGWDVTWNIGGDAWKVWHGKLPQPAHPAEIGIWIQCQEMKGHTSGDDQ